MAEDAKIASNVTMADVLGKSPALSATSDMPVVENVAVEPPDPKIDEKTAPEVKEPETKDPIEAKTPEAKAAEDAEAKEIADGKGKAWDALPPWTKRELTKARNQKRAAEDSTKILLTRAEKAEADAKAAADERAAALKALDELSGKKETVDLPRPTRDKFDSPEAYDVALMEWARAEGEKSALARTKAEHQAALDLQNKEVVEKRNKEVFETYQSRRLKAMEEIPDYVDVAESDKVTISQPMAAIIMDAENGPQLAYHLGKNPTEADRIAKLSPQMQVFEMGRLAGELARPKPADLTRAPDPIAPLAARNNADRKTLHEIGTEPGNMDEYASLRERQLYPHRFKNGGAASPH